jgi:hypothetical protein
MTGGAAPGAERFFVLRGDGDPGALAEAFAGLLALSRDDPGPFVAQRLAASDLDIARAAALALGDARCPEAVSALQDHPRREEQPPVRHAIVLGLAASRDEGRAGHLLDLIASGGAADPRAAAEALRLYTHDEALPRWVQAALDRHRQAPRPRRSREGHRA